MCNIRRINIKKLTPIHGKMHSYEVPRIMVIIGENSSFCY